MEIVPEFNDVNEVADVRGVPGIEASDAVDEWLDGLSVDELKEARDMYDGMHREQMLDEAFESVCGEMTKEELIDIRESIQDAADEGDDPQKVLRMRR